MSTWPIIIERNPISERLRATWYSQGPAVPVTGDPALTMHGALRNLADQLEREAGRQEILAAIDSTP